MQRRPYIRMEAIRRRWEESPFHGGMLGIASVAAATAGIAIVCTVIALIVTLIY